MRRTLSMNSTLKTTRTPPIAPIMMALRGDTLAQGAVTATSPARAPFKAMLVSGFPKRIQAVNMANIAPAAAARFVVTAMIAMLKLVPEVVLPELKPNQANHKIKTPSAANGILWPGIAFELPSLLYFPSLGPSTRAPANAAHPPTESIVAALAVSGSVAGYFPARRATLCDPIEALREE